MNGPLLDQQALNKYQLRVYFGVYKWIIEGGRWVDLGGVPLNIWIPPDASGCLWVPLGAIGCIWVPRVPLRAPRCCLRVPLGASGCPWVLGAFLQNPKKDQQTSTTLTNINTYQQISNIRININKHEQISTNINKYEQIININKYQQISTI